MTTYTYAAILHKDPTSDFGVQFPDVLGCFSAGETQEEAVEMAAEALQEHLLWMLEDGDALPQPRTQNQLQPWIEEEGFVGLVWIDVEIPMAAETQNHSGLSNTQTRPETLRSKKPRTTHHVAPYSSLPTLLPAAKEACFLKPPAQHDKQ